MNISNLELAPVSFANGDVTLRGSKSIANRVLPLAAVGKGNIQLQNMPDGDDVKYMLDSLAKLDIVIEQNRDNFLIHGSGRPFESKKKTNLYLGNSGTASRFLTALLSTGSGEFVIDGVERLRERPVGDLTSALSGLANSAGNHKSTAFKYPIQNGYPPLEISAAGLDGGRTTINGNLSSQFLTGLLMALPLCRGRSHITVGKKLVSRPYVNLTLDIMKIFNAQINHENLQIFSCISPRGYINPKKYFIEPDASSASYFLAAGAIAGGTVHIHGIGSKSLQFQGEGGFAGVLERMGAKVNVEPNRITVSKGRLKGIEINMDSMSDTAMTLAVTALFADGPTHITNIGNWRIKETDRLTAMSAELRKLGAEVITGESDIHINPPKEWKPAQIQTYDDHRMAMSFSLASFSDVPISLCNPGCVGKTYPDFFKDFTKITSRNM